MLPHHASTQISHMHITHNYTLDCEDHSSHFWRPCFGRPCHLDRRWPEKRLSWLWCQNFGTLSPLKLVCLPLLLFSTSIWRFFVLFSIPPINQENKTITYWIKHVHPHVTRQLLLTDVDILYVLFSDVRYRYLDRYHFITINTRLSWKVIMSC